MAPIFSFDAALASGLGPSPVVAFGVFDGVHCGHQHLLARACEQAHQRGVKTLVLTFDTDPDEMFSPVLRKLQSNAQRLQAIAASGVDAVVVLNFTPRLAALSAEAFLDDVMAPLSPGDLFIGCDCRFGKGAQGDIETLDEWARHQNVAMDIHAIDLLCIDGQPVTSTRIRTLLGKGDIAQANTLLGHPFELVGTVASGRHQGRELGFPTANIEVPQQLRVLAEGVYAGYAEIDGDVWRAAASVGPSPVFADCGAASCEVHILDFNRDIYGRELRVRFYERIRPMINFDTVEQLSATVRDNIDWVRDNMPNEEARA